MNKAVMISIQPKWCELIASGKKTIEVRKTKPSIKPPFKCYIYETKKLALIFDGGVEFRTYKYRGRGKVIGEFVCDKIDEMLLDYNPVTKQFFYNDNWANNDWNSNDYCLSVDEINSYGKGNPLYGWHISDLKIYDKPKELSEFEKPCICKDTYEDEEYCDCLNCELAGDSDYGVIACDRHLTRPPQSWCYVEEMEDVTN